MSALRLIGVIIVSAALSCNAERDLEQPTQHYQTRTAPNADGIGKWYMGREIAHTMGHQGAAWLERPERQREERTDLLLSNLELDPNDVIADIGAGTGYFTFRLARRVPRGKVYAVDVQPEMLAYIDTAKQRHAVANVEAVLGSEKNPNLPPASIDVVLLVDAYHEFTYPREMMQKIARALKPDGRVVLIEYRGEDPLVPIKPLHKMSERQAKAELAALGLVLKDNRRILPWQHFLIFGKQAP